MGIVSVADNLDLFGQPMQNTKTIDRDMLAERLAQCFKDMTLGEFVACLTNEYTEIIQYIDLCNGDKACQKTSLLFNQHRLCTKTKSSKVSLYEALQDEHFASGLARATIFQKGKVSELLYNTIQLGINGVQYVNEFPPHVARNLARKYHLGLDSKVLDPCAGWGGRMIGMSTVVNNYTAFEPSTRTYHGLLHLADWLRSFRDDFAPVLLHECYEDSMLRSNHYDFALTSPPYYDTEEYSDEQTNSLNRYSSFDDWRQMFYVPLIEKTMRSLKPGATFVLNIGSRKYPLNQIMLDVCCYKYTVTKEKAMFSGVGAGLGKSGEGETVYCITKSKETAL